MNFCTLLVCKATFRMLPKAGLSRVIHRGGEGYLEYDEESEERIKRCALHFYLFYRFELRIFPILTL